MNKHLSITISVVLCLFTFLTSNISAQTKRTPAIVKIDQEEAVRGEVIVVFKKNTRSDSRSNLHSGIRARIKARFKYINADLVKLREGTSIKKALAYYKSKAKVAHVEPNYMLSIGTTLLSTLPDDSSFSSLWGLHNTGQTGGKNDADIDAPEAWNITTGSSDIIVAVIDTGVDYTHPDLKDNMWTNDAELNGDPGIDDDNNGFVDDIYGYDFYNDDGDPMDDNSHGTHCSGTIGANGNNGIGVAGVNWNVKIMALKFLGSSGGGSTADAIKCVNYATQMGAHLTSNSWGGGGFSQAMKDAIEANGTPFVAAAGNSSANTDVYKHYPSSYDSPNVISVMSTTSTDSISGFSNYGATSVDIAAPGSSILSTTPGNTYKSYSGTSMATPHVAGVIALVMSAYPDATMSEVINRLYLGGDTLSVLSGKCTTGKRLNAFGALTTEFTTGSLRVTISPQEAINDGAKWSYDGSSSWYTSGQTVNNVPSGNRLISYLNINGWIEPEDEFVTVSEGATATANGNYVNSWPGPDSFGNSGETGTGGFEDISETGTLVELEPTSYWLPGDEGKKLIPIGFGFDFYGTTHNSLYAFSNGGISFDSSANLGYTILSFPSLTAPKNLIAPFWDDLHLRDTGFIKYEVRGSTPTRRLIIQWKAGHYSYGSTEEIEFQLKLYENGGKIEFCYKDVFFASGRYSNNAGRASIGIQNATGSTGLLYSFNGFRKVYDDDIITIASDHNEAPQNDSVLPNSGKGSFQVFTAEYLDPNGFDDMKYLYLKIGTTGNPANNAYIRYCQDNNKVYLRSDSGKTWLGGSAIGTKGLLENNQMSVDLERISAEENNSTVKLIVPITFKENYAGSKNIYMNVLDSEYSAAGWQKMGTFEVIANSDNPSVVSVSPQNGIGAWKTFTATYSDPNGADDLKYLYFKLGPTNGISNLVYVRYRIDNGQVSLRQDSGSGWINAGYAGENKYAKNSQVVIKLRYIKAIKSGNNLEFRIPMIFSNSFAGNHKIYLYCIDRTRLNSGWQEMGTFSVTASSSSDYESYP